MERYLYQGKIISFFSSVSLRRVLWIRLVAWHWFLFFLCGIVRRCRYPPISLFFGDGDISGESGGDLSVWGNLMDHLG